MKKTAVRQVAGFGLLLALSLILSLLEGSVLLLPLPLPGVKVGLSNIATIFALMFFGVLPALLLSVVRALLLSFFAGGMTMFFFSAAGGMMSVFAMAAARRFYPAVFSAAGISVAGGVFHNVGQVLAAIFFLKSVNYIYYLPVLSVFGVAFGFVTGFLYGVVERSLRKAEIFF